MVHADVPEDHQYPIEARTAPRALDRSPWTSDCGVRASQSLSDTPPKEFGVAHRYQESSSRKAVCFTNHRDQIVVCFGNGMGEQTHFGAVAGNTSLPLNYFRLDERYGVKQFACTVMPMNAQAQLITRLPILVGCQPNRVAGHCELQGRSLKSRQRFAHLESQFGIQAQRCAVVRHLYQSDSRPAEQRVAVEDSLHQGGTDVV